MSLDISLWHALYDLEVRYWRDINLNSGAKAHEFYTTDGIFVVGDKKHTGRDAIREFYTWRAQRGARTARHMVTNFCVQAGTDPTTASAVGMVSNFAADGAPPLPSEPAALVADLTNHYGRGDHGGWLFKSHVLTPIFVGEDPLVKGAVR